MSQIKIYLAGPFFNADQLRVIERLEEVLDPICKLFSPRREGGTIGKDAKRSPQQIFEDNYKAIIECDLMVAQIESLDNRPLDIAISSIEKLATGASEINHNLYKQIKEDACTVIKEEMEAKLPNYSDIGTIWEMGVAYELSKPVIAFSPNKLRKLNVMLLHSCRGFVHDYDKLKEVVVKVLNGESVDAPDVTVY